MGQKRKNAIKTLMVRWGLITIIALLTLSGIYHFDKFQGTRVFGPLVELWLINDEIVNNKEMEAKYVGYTDTTKYSDRIRELTKERQDKFYNSEDEVIAYVSTRPAIVKLLIGLLSIILMVIVTFLPLLILFGMYYEHWDRFKRKWQKASKTTAARHVDYKEFRRFEHKIVSLK